MSNKIWVISLGGSRIVPDNVDTVFLEKFKKLISSHPTHKFVVVTGGGSTARKYIFSLKQMGKKTKVQSLEGIDVTRLHAEFLTRIFGKIANKDIPLNMKKIEGLLKKNQIVFCGALRYQDRNTSDGTAAQIAAHIKRPFINLTNVKGLYDKDPKKYKDTKFISKITWTEFDKIARKIKYTAGQHFVLDQTASKRILKHKIPTYIVGSLKAIDNILKGKENFGGTLIFG
jgi:uridylate kinase